jgi:hypothetical protein
VNARGLVAALLVGLAGCGGSPDPGPVDSATEEAANREQREEETREGQADLKAGARAARSHNPDDD